MKKLTLSLLLFALASTLPAQTVTTPWRNLGKTGSDLADLATRDASDLTNTPAGNIAATDAQAAINELDTEKATTAQGALADSATQPGDDVSTLTNDSGYLTTALANPQFAARATRRALVSDGSNAVSSVPPEQIALGVADFTILAWKTYTGSSTGYVYGYGSSSSGTSCFLSSSTLYVRIGTSGGWLSLGTHNLIVGDWVLVAVSFDRDGNATGYINGSQIGTSDISAVSAHSATPGSSNSFYLGGDTNGDGRSGVYGEFAISSDLATAAQIATIHANGTARGSGLTMLAHWEPSLSQGVLFEDISGNNLHAIIGTTGITRNYELAESSAPASQALVSDGTNGSKLYSTLNGQDPGTGDFTLVGDVNLGSTNSTGIDVVAALTSSTSTTFAQANAFGIYTTAGGVRVTRYGVTINDYRRLNAGTELLAALKASRSFIAATRDSSGVKVWTNFGTSNIYNITALFEEVTGGSTVPAWTDSVTGTYLVGSYRDASASYALTYLALELLNVAPTLAEFEYRIRNGVWEPKFAAGGSVGYVSDFSAGLSDFAAVGATLTNNYDSGDAGHSTCLRIVSIDGTSDRAELTFSDIPIGSRVRVSFDAKEIVGGSSIRTQAADGSSTYYTVGATAAWVTTTQEFELAGSLGLKFRAYSSVSGSAGDELLIDNVSVTVLGLTTSLDLSDGGGYQPKNPRAANGSSQWSMSTSGVTWTKPATYGKTLSVTGSLTWAGTHEAKSLLGQKALPSNAIIDAITFVATAGSTGDGITIGTTTDPDQFVTVNTYTTTAENFAGSQLTSPFPGGTATNDLTIVVDPDTANYTGSITTTVTYHLANY